MQVSAQDKDPEGMAMRSKPIATQGTSKDVSAERCVTVINQASPTKASKPFTTCYCGEHNNTNGFCKEPHLVLLPLPRRAHLLDCRAGEQAY